MPTVDLTLPSVAATNAANETAGGAVQGVQYADAQHLAQAHLSLLQKSEADRNALEQAEQARRRDALARLDEQTGGENDFLTQAIGNMAGPAPAAASTSSGPRTTNDSFFGPKPDQSETAQVTSKYQEHARQVLDFSQHLSPTARNVYLGHFLPMLQGEHAQEIQDANIRTAVRGGQELLQLGQLDPEEQAVLQHGLQGLTTGEEDLKSYGAMRDKIVESASRRYVRQQTLQAGTGFMQQMQQAGGMAVDPGPLNAAYAKWVADPNGTMDELKAALTPLAFGIKPARVKLGNLDLPAPQKDTDRGAYLSQVFPALNAQAQSDALAELSKDPEIAAAMKDGTGKVPADYQQRRDALVRSKAEGLAAQLGYSPDEIDAAADQYTSAQQQRTTMRTYKALDPAVKAYGLPPERAVGLANDLKGLTDDQQRIAVFAKYGIHPPAQEPSAQPSAPQSATPAASQKPSKSSARAAESLQPQYITKPEYLYPDAKTGRTGGQTQDEAANVLRGMAKDAAKTKGFAEKGGVSTSPGRADRSGQDEYEIASGKLEQAISEYESLYGDVPKTLKAELDRLRSGK